MKIIGRKVHHGNFGEIGQREGQVARHPVVGQTKRDEIGKGANARWNGSEEKVASEVEVSERKERGEVKRIELTYQVSVRQVNLGHRTPPSSSTTTRNSKPRAWTGTGSPRTEGAKISVSKSGFPLEESSSFGSYQRSIR